MSPDSLMEIVAGRSMKQEALDAVKCGSRIPVLLGRGVRQERTRKAIREKVDCGVFDALLMEGRAWSIERSIDEAISI